MPTPEFNTANHELAVYASTVKEEEKKFSALNVAFSKENSVFPTLTIVNPTNEQEYWGYGGIMESLDNEEEINTHIEMHDFISQQLRNRLRTKSKAAIAVREDVKELKAIFKDVIEQTKDGDDSASL